MTNIYLSMANSKRDNNFTEYQIRGVNLAVKATKKMYPFIKGWKFADNYQKYDAHLYIDIIVDFEELYDFYGVKLKDYFIKKKIENPKDLKTSALFSYGDWGDNDTEEYKKMADESYNKGMELKNTISNAYTYIPEDMVINYSFEFLSGRKDNVPVILTVSDFVQQSNG
jgi:hypothetical protein